MIKKDWLHEWSKAVKQDFRQLGWATRLSKQEKQGIFARFKGDCVSCNERQSNGKKEG